MQGKVRKVSSCYLLFQQKVRKVCSGYILFATEPPEKQVTTKCFFEHRKNRYFRFFTKKVSRATYFFVQNSEFAGKGLNLAVSAVFAKTGPKV